MIVHGCDSEVIEEQKFCFGQFVHELWIGDVSL